MAITLRPIRFAYWIQRCPKPPPAPAIQRISVSIVVKLQNSLAEDSRTATQFPAFALDCFKALYTVTPAQRIGAASSSFIPSGILLRWFVNETAYCWKEPSTCDNLLSATPRNQLKTETYRETRQLGFGAQGFETLSAEFAVHAGVREPTEREVSAEIFRKTVQNIPLDANSITDLQAGVRVLSDSNDISSTFVTTTEVILGVEGPILLGGVQVGLIGDISFMGTFQKMLELT